MSLTDVHTANRVDVNWTITVMNPLRLTPMFLMKPQYIPLLVHHCGRRPSWRMDTNFRW